MRAGMHVSITHAEHAVINLLEQCTSQPAEVRVLGVVDLCNAPRIYSGTNRLAIKLNFFL